MMCDKMYNELGEINMKKWKLKLIKWILGNDLLEIAFEQETPQMIKPIRYQPEYRGWIYTSSINLIRILKIPLACTCDDPRPQKTQYNISNFCASCGKPIKI
jgi:hypothetical protein